MGKMLIFILQLVISCKIKSLPFAKKLYKNDRYSGMHFMYKGVKHEPKVQIVVVMIQDWLYMYTPANLEHMQAALN